MVSRTSTAKLRSTNSQAVIPRSHAPIPYATAAAPPPMASVLSAECHQGRMDHCAFRAPIATKSRLVTAAATQKAFPRPATNGSSGTRPQIRKDEKVDPAACHGERTAAGNPYSYRSIMRTQRSRSAVMAGTTRSSRSSPEPESAQNLAHLLPLALWNVFDMAMLHRLHIVEFLVFRPRSQIIAGRHGETVRNQTGAAKDENHAGRQVRARPPPRPAQTSSPFHRCLHRPNPEHSCGRARPRIVREWLHVCVRAPSCVTSVQWQCGGRKQSLLAIVDK